MRLKISIVLLTSFFCTTLLYASPIKLSGSVKGMNKDDKVIVLNIMGDTLGVIGNNNGTFALDRAIPGASIYTIQMANFKNTIYIDRDISVTGFLDSAKPENSKISFIGSESNNVFVKQYLEMKKVCDADAKHWENIISGSNHSDEEKDAAFGKLFVMLRVQNLVKDELLKITDKNIQASVAFMFRGNNYDTANFLYSLLSKDAQESYSGKMLKQFIKSKESLQMGAPAPNFTLKDINGKEKSLSDWKGNVVVLDFWASWCGPCRSEMKFLKKLQSTLNGKKVIFVSISLDNTEDLWRKAHSEENIQWESLWGGAWKTSEIRKLYDFFSIPHIAIIDADGNYCGKDYRRNALVNKLNELLK